MRALIRSGTVPGILAYAGREPVGWCSVAPREDFSALGNSRILKPIDDEPVWSIVCFFVAKEWRKKGLSVRLLEAAADYAAGKGAAILEGYPVEPRKKPMPEAFAYTGLASAYRKAGFRERARRSETRPIMRLELEKKRTIASNKRPAGVKKRVVPAKKRAAPAKARTSRSNGAPAGEARILCRTPTPGKKGVRIAAWKYDLVRRAIRQALGRGRKGVPFKELPSLVRKKIRPADLGRLGSLSWYTVTVKLDLEVRGEIERLPGPGPQRLRRVH